MTLMLPWFIGKYNAGAAADFSKQRSVSPDGNLGIRPATLGTRVFEDVLTFTIASESLDVT
ncbi:hypothetical protein J6590_062826 [Homalodisca vitripennis]|nr:hypothetical protein J6590_062826 [Homalodisca vitripennis]